MVKEQTLDSKISLGKSKSMKTKCGNGNGSVAYLKGILGNIVCNVICSHGTIKRKAVWEM